MAQLIDIKMNLAEARRIVIAKIKNENKGKVIVLFKICEVIKAYDEDAEVIAKYCGLVYKNVYKQEKENCALMEIMISSDKADMIYPRMVREGYKLCVIE